MIENENLGLEFTKNNGENQRLATRLFDNLIEGIMITDTNGSIQYINSAFTRITGYGKEALGKNPRILKSGKHQQPFYESLWNTIERNGQWKGEIWNKKKSGEYYLQWSTITGVRDDAGKVIYYTAVMTDITKNKLEEEKWKNDLLLANEIQKGMLSPPIKNNSLVIEGLHMPSELLGGDMYVWYKIDENRYGIFLMDVMGHGVASALVGMSIRSLLRGVISRLVSPEKVLKELNKHVYALFRNQNTHITRKYYLTGLYVLIDLQEKKVYYSSAGHPPGLLMEKTGRITELNVGTIPLGIMANIEVETGIVNFQGETTLFLYTDGLLETIKERINHLKENLRDNRDASIHDLLPKIYHTFKSINHFAEDVDDVTLIGAKFN